MNKLKTVFGFELSEMLKRKTVIMSTIIIAVICFAITFAPTLLFNDTDNGNSDGGPIEEITLHAAIYVKEFEGSDTIKTLLSSVDGVEIVSSVEAVHDAINDKGMSSGFEINSPLEYVFYTQDQSIYSNDQYTYESILGQYIVDQRLSEAGIDANVVSQAQNVTFTSEDVIMGKSAANGMFIAFAILFILYMLILLYGQTVATSVAREKDSRTMELLITSTKPKVLILGKVFASGLLGVLQVAFILLVVYIGFMINKGNYPPFLVELIGGALTLKTTLVYVLFSVSGYILYLFIYAALGSLVSKVEDVNSVVQPITYIFVIAYMIATFAMQMPSTAIVKVSSYIPFVSVFTMPIRSMLTTVSSAEIFISMSIMIATTVLIAMASIYIYRFGSLNYGNKIKLRSVLKSLSK